jgi:hypothetical protein
MIPIGPQKERAKDRWIARKFDVHRLSLVVDRRRSSLPTIWPDGGEAGNCYNHPRHLNHRNGRIVLSAISARPN